VSRLVRIASSSSRNRTLAGFQRVLGQILNVVDFGKDASAIEINATLFKLKGDECFINVANNLIRDQCFLINRFSLFYSRFGAFALVSIVDR
jgi:hypothetical protein